MVSLCSKKGFIWYHFLAHPGLNVSQSWYHAVAESAPYQYQFVAETALYGISLVHNLHYMIHLLQSVSYDTTLLHSQL